jgi:hypothetical protein
MRRKLKVWSYVVNRIQEKINLKMGSKSFESVAKFRYLGTALTNQNYVRDEINNRSKTENYCYRVIQNILSFRVV